VKHLSADGRSLVDAYVRKGDTECGMTPVFAIDEKGNLLNTEPLCIINERYFPSFFDWLKGKFEEEAILDKLRRLGGRH